MKKGKTEYTTIDGGGGGGGGGGSRQLVKRHYVQYDIWSNKTTG